MDRYFSELQENNNTYKKSQTEDLSSISEINECSESSTDAVMIRSSEGNKKIFNREHYQRLYECSESSADAVMIRSSEGNKKMLNR